MSEAELLRLLDELRKLPHETEWVELKEANNDYDFRKLGKYFSALANEANLKERPCGWLVFGVVNNDRSICGSRYRENPAELDSLKHELAAQTTGGITFLDIHAVQHADGRVVMFQVPPASQGVPVAFQGHWYGRDGESLVPLGLQELETIRSQVQLDDWSAAVCPEARLDDLDPNAVAAARANFRAKNQDKPFAREMDSWSVATFLDRAKLTAGGRVTRTALLLLGRAEAAHHLQPAVPQITWRLDGPERGYEHFGPPFLLTVNDLYARIRNINQKIDVPGRLVPLEVPKYEKWVVLEALHNAIAHQEYARQSRIIVTETPDFLTFESAGRFFEGQVSDYTLGNRTPQRYRNPFLAHAMVNVNMIDTMGYGILRMFQEQRRRFYPLPDFDLSHPDKVLVTVHGKVIDPNYTALLMEQQDLPLETVVLLDRVQKRLPIEKPEAAFLRKRKLAEGRFPKLFVAAHIASATGDKAQYIKNRAFDDDHYKQMILEFLKQFGQATRKEIDDLLLDKLSDVLDEAQKRNKVRNFLQSLASAGLIRNSGSRARPRWVLDLVKESKI
jgi:ATP-dependent DNA helicase RecG